MNIFTCLKKYAEKWQVTERRKFSEDEKDEILSAKVVDSQYGSSVCFMMKEGGMSYIPLDQNSSKAVGDTVNLDEAELLTLSKTGEADIYRVSC